MPQVTKNAPDSQDAYKMCASIGEEFGLIVEFSCRYYADYVQVIARARPAVIGANADVIVQALSKYKYGSKTAREQIEYSLAFDLWCQLDGGGATAAQRGVPYDWQGRVQTPRAGRKQ
jgi:hypothetical protein